MAVTHLRNSRHAYPQSASGSEEDRCEEGRGCPNVFFTDRLTLLIQGYIVNDTWILEKLNLVPGKAVVKVPLSLLPELANTTPRYTDTGSIFFADQETIIIQGDVVTDVEVLASLSIPSGETVVEISLSLLPELEGDVAQYA